MNKILNLITNKKNQLLITVGILSILSLITIYGITPQLVGYGSNPNSLSFVIKQSVGMIVGAIAVFIILKMNLDKALKIVNIINIVLIVMLLIQAIDPPIIGDYFVVKVNGAKGWFKLPFIGTIQPLEFFKITMIIKLADISSQSIKLYKSDSWILKRFFIYGALPIVCVVMQPDLGGTILLGVPWIVMLLITLKDTRRVKRILLFVVIAILILGVFLFIPQLQRILIDYTPLKAYQLSRINSWLYPFEFDGGFQLQQALILMGSAGPFGYGFGNIYISLPEPHTDVIFAEFVGMFGYIAGIILIGLYANILNITIKTVTFARKHFDKMLIIGYFILLFVQIIENIGMMLGMLPITGIVLPFMSYGVSALITYFVIIGIICNINQKYNTKK